MTNVGQRPWRSWAAGVLGTLACLLLPFALVSAWVAAIVSDTDRYVATVAPLADDAAIQVAVERRLETAIVTRIDLGTQQARLQALLEERGNDRLARLVPLLGQLLTTAAESAVNNTVEAVVRSQEFSDAWEAANRSAHEQLVAILEGDDDAAVATDGRVSIELATLVNSVTSQLAAKGFRLANQVPTLDASFTIVSEEDLTPIRRWYTLIKDLGWWLPALVLLFAGAAIVLSGRRRRSIGLIAGGFAVGALLVAVALRVGRRELVEGLPSDSDPVAAKAVFDIVVATLRYEVWAILVISLIVVAVIWIVSGRPVRPNRGAS